jgi:ABC-type multidrug transport system ATPase subunit
MAVFQTYLSSQLRSIFLWALFSIGLWKLSEKLNWKHRWMAWVPGLRYMALGNSLDMAREGIVCGVVEILIDIFNLAVSNINIQNDNISVAMSLAVLILIVMLYVYRIRFFIRLIRVFGLKTRWILLWLIAEWIPVLILGFGKQYQPKDLPIQEEWVAGTSPAEIAGAEGIHSLTASEAGLSVDLYERTAKDFLKKRYLLKDISLDIPNGSLVMLLGGSGSGETTLVNAIIGYEKAKARMTLNGADIYRDYKRMKYRIGFVPQKNLIRGNDTVIRTVDDAALLRLPRGTKIRARRNRVHEVLDLLGLSAGAEGFVTKKSGGQLRRISIAMELVSDPELFVLDEPDSGLDGVIAREIFTKLREIADEGKIVIVITHTPDRVIDLFDKVIVLARDSGRVGRLAFYGSPQEAREFFGKDSMEGIVMSVNRKEEGGDGLADHFIASYAALAASEGGVTA